MLTDQLKFGRQASYHMWSAKLWSILLFAALILLMGFNTAPWFFTLSLWWGVLAEIEGLTTSLILPKWTHDVPTFWHAYQLRQEVGS